MKNLIQIVAAGVFGLAIAASAAAQEPPQGGGPRGGGGHGMMRQACAADIQKLCPDAKPGPGGGMRQCIMSHQSDLSDGCKAALAQMQARMQARMQAGGGGGGAANP